MRPRRRERREEVLRREGGAREEERPEGEEDREGGAEKGEVGELESTTAPYDASDRMLLGRFCAAPPAPGV